MERPGDTLLAVLALLCAVGMPASAVESHTYHGESGFSGSFTLAGGRYSLYINAYFARTYKTHAPDSCIFVGNLQRVSPTRDSMQFGTAAPISNPIHYKLGPAPMTLPAGRYKLSIASTTDCQWLFSLEAAPHSP